MKTTVLFHLFQLHLVCIEPLQYLVALFLDPLTSLLLLLQLSTQLFVVLLRTGSTKLKLLMTDLQLRAGRDGIHSDHWALLKLHCPFHMSRW